MAHTLSIYDGVEATTIALASTGSGAGYYLENYMPLDPQYTVSYSSSLFTDGARPVHSKAGNIIETVSLFIRGSSADDAMAKLRALKRAIWNARSVAQMPALRQPCYIIFTPHGTTNAGYSIVLNGSCNEPQTFLDTDLNAYEIRNVVLTIEREPFWRGTAPLRSGGGRTQAQQQTGVTNDWYSMSVSSANVPGDIPSLCAVQVTPTSGSFSNIILSYTSERINPYYNSDPLIEAETLAVYTDANIRTSTGTSGDSDVRVTFATTATNAIRLYGSLARAGRFRAYALMFVDSGTTITTYIDYGEAALAGRTSVSTPTRTIVGAGQWRIVEFGPIVTPQHDSATKSSADTYINLYMARTTGSGYVYIDFLYLAPIDYFVTCSSFTASSSDSTAYYYENIYPWANHNGVIQNSGVGLYKSGIGAGRLLLPPGNGRLNILCGDANWQSAWTGAGTASTKTITLYRSSLYLGARGSG